MRTDPELGFLTSPQIRCLDAPALKTASVPSSRFLGVVPALDQPIPLSAVSGWKTRRSTLMHSELGIMTNRVPRQSKSVLLVIVIGTVIAVFGGLTRPTRGTGTQTASDLAATARATLSKTSGTVPVKGLEHAVSVLRDRWGVPHIYADNQQDLFFAQGFVAAQDRLFQMELWKRVGQGRLAEILGPEFLKRDINARLLRYRGPSEAEYASYGPDTRAILEAFTAGINEYIRHRLLPDGPGLPVEFRLAGFAPEPWKPEDCLMRLAGFPMTGNAGRELFSAQLVGKLGARATAVLDL